MERSRRGPSVLLVSELNAAFGSARRSLKASQVRGMEGTPAVQGDENLKDTKSGKQGKIVFGKKK